MRLSTYLLTAIVLLSAGCSLLPDQVDQTSEWSANQLYSAAKKELNSKNYEKAIELFEKLEARFPFGRYAQQAQLEIAYAYYKYDEPESAIAAADHFIKIYPRHPNVDYAWYIRGLTNYNRGKTFVDKFLPQDASQRDTRSMRKAFDDFARLATKYPESRYAKDAAQRMIYLRNNMARYEMHVADYYMRRGAYIAALNRGRYVVENYQRTPAIADALVIMVQANRKLGMDDLAADSLKVLGLNYPDHPELAVLESNQEADSSDTPLWKFW